MLIFHQLVGPDEAIAKAGLVMALTTVLAVSSIGCGTIHRPPAVVFDSDTARIRASLGKELASLVPIKRGLPPGEPEGESYADGDVLVEVGSLEAIREQIEVLDGGRICRGERLERDGFCDFDGFRVEYSPNRQRVSVRISPEVSCEVPGRPKFAVRWGPGVTVVTGHAMGTTAFPVQYGAMDCSDIGQVEYGGFIMTDVALVPGSIWLYAVDHYGGVYHWAANGEAAIVALFRVPIGNDRYAPGDALEGSEDSIVPRGIVVFPGGEVAVWGMDAGWFSVPEDQFHNGVRFRIVDTSPHRPHRLQDG